MRDVTFYRAWLLVPIAVPLVLGLAGPVTPTPPEPWLTVWIYLWLSLAFGAVPYLVVVLLVWGWLPGQSPWRVRAAAVMCPLPMIGFNALVVLGPWLLVAAITYGWVAIFLISDLVAHALGLVREGACSASGQLTCAAPDGRLR